MTPIRATVHRKLHGSINCIMFIFHTRYLCSTILLSVIFFFNEITLAYNRRRKVLCDKTLHFSVSLILNNLGNLVSYKQYNDVSLISKKFGNFVSYK